MRYILYFLCFFVVLSCSESLEELNVDPDKSPSAGDAQLLTAAEGSLSWVVEGQYNELGSLWGQYWTWGPGVSLGDEERYVQEAVDYDNEWSHMYARVLTNLNIVIGSEDPHYSGVAKILKAYGVQLLVDNFGDIPYSQANLGEIADGYILTPTYDDDAAVYATLIPLIDEGIEDLNSVMLSTVGSDDFVYGGNIGNWIKFANSLKLKILMRQSDAGTAAADVQALINEGNFIETANDMAKIDFDGTAGSENPMYADFESGVSFFYVASSTSLDLLVENNDPRLEVLYNPAVNSGSYVGIAQGDVDSEPFTNTEDDYSQATALCYAQANPVLLMTPWEVWFYRAEAAARFGTSDDEMAALTNATQAHFDFVGLGDATDFVSALGYSTGLSLNEKLEIIGVQKWISFNGLQEGEGWIESRRFDTPDNPVFKNLFATPPLSVLPPNVHPSIYFYPETEVARNPNTPAQHATTDKVFWDK